ncbi:D-alanyl-D-alanine carboxypeptidase/D-alanyl-D-alanine endopeptidase [Butyricimonas faecalis]|uniref:D-alanyl-D-alanine carboxypeptidase/D-alanyl-D-alanine-endopeptidase n=1 Tax=Butyricimonas faecalis TaxID=2093856 RepID=A0A3Q9IMW6_9BACT|nr:D-alanyl-D-alanine carboxypeptidase/D-alanyl-D-alanine-endopeptidase [Butyricimonas faecalis]AZS29011.1 D-alanyl-D-alanine carboxypeptidase/D-alanyl-D-alanine-endopeptidase [Butyricimonas faecalis]
MMKSGWLLFFMLISMVSALGQTRIDERNLWGRDEVKHAAIGVCVKNVETGQVVYEHNPGMALRPASVIKLLSSALALKREGDSLTYTTKVFYTGRIENGALLGNIVIQAGGDPTLDSKYFPQAGFMDSLVSKVENLGIQRIHGNIIIETEGEPARIPGSWPWEDVANYYGALYHSFNYRDNTYTITLKSGKSGTQTKIVSVVPAVPGVKLRNEVMASAKHGNDAWIYGGPEAVTLLIQGTILVNRSSFAVKGAMHHPDACFRAELEKRLKGKGIVLDKQKIKEGERHALLTMVSPFLKDIVYYTNKNSVNLFAEALGELISPTDYAKTVKAELSDMGIDSCGITLKDASGLSPANAVPAEVFTDVLIWARRYLSDAFVLSLPRGNVDWSLRIYSDHPVLRGNVVAKTGSMSGVRALAGYLKTRQGETLAFTILVNNYVGDPVKVQECMRDLLKEVADK